MVCVCMCDEGMIEWMREKDLYWLYDYLIYFTSIEKANIR